MKNKYFTEHERYQLEILLKKKTPVKEIAEIFGKCKATIYNEIKRGTVTLLNSEYEEYRIYQADVAQRKYDEAKKNKGRDYKIGNDYKFVHFVEDKIINEKWSPDAIVGYIRTHSVKISTRVCKATLYSYIKKGLFLNVTVDNLPYGCKARHSVSERRTVALKNLKGRSIDTRPEHIEARKEYGHWEMDTVVSGRGKGKACLLVLSERMTREELIVKIKDRTSRSVISALNSLERTYGSRRFRNIFKTITVDNGVEFLDYTSLEKSYYNKHLKRTIIYYCHPFCSCERATNENINKMIRRFVPKGSDISALSNSYISYIQDWINNYPRRIFGYKSTYEYKQENGIL